MTPGTVACLPGSSVHGVLQARILEWVAILFSRGSSWPRDQTQVSCITGRFFTIWATREVLASAGEIRDMGLISGSGRSPGRGHGNPLQYFCLENPMDRGAWQVTIHGVRKSQAWLKRLSTHTSTVSYIPQSTMNRRWHAPHPPTECLSHRFAPWCSQTVPTVLPVDCQNKSAVGKKKRKKKKKHNTMNYGK